MNNSESSKSPIGGYLVPSIADIIFFGLFPCMLLLTGQRLLNDGDTGYHIRAGEYIIDTLSIPRQDPFSFISPALPWTAHEWLSELIMASIHKVFGLTGVVVFFAGMIALTYYLLFLHIRKHNKYLLVVLAVTALVIASSTLHWLARPHIFSLILLVIWYHILDSFQSGRDNFLYALPLMMLAWVNLHGGFMSGFVLLTIYAMGNFYYAYICAGPASDHGSSKLFSLVKISLLCLAAACVNPYGPSILVFPFHLVGDTYIMNHVAEFISPNFHEPMTHPFRIMLLSLIALVIASKRRLDIIQTGLALIFLNMALYSARYITLFAIIIAPTLSSLTEGLIEQHKNGITSWLEAKDAGISEIDGQAKGYFWLIASSLGIILYYIQSGTTLSFDPKLKPIAAVEFLKQENISGNMFNNDEFGDYIIYSAWPQYKVFIDGRLDMYGEKVLKEYYSITQLHPDWISVLKKYEIDWVIFNTNSVLCRYLNEQTNWHLIYSDKVASIFVRNTSRYRELIEKYQTIQLDISDASL